MLIEVRDSPHGIFGPWAWCSRGITKVIHGPSVIPFLEESPYMDRRSFHFWKKLYMIHGKKPLLRISLTRCFYCLLTLTLHFTLAFSEIASPWRSVKVPWRVPWRGKSGFSFAAVREGPWRFREELREGVRGLGKTCLFPVQNWLLTISIEPAEPAANYRVHNM